VAIVVNSGPLISLARIGLLDLLPKLFDEILVPDAVFQEVTQDQRLPGALAVKEADWLKFGEISDREAVIRLSFWLDAGESEVLVLAQEIGATAVIDERRGRNLATALGIPQTGTIGILLAAKRAGAIPEITPLLNQLMASGVRLSSRLYEEARQLAGEA
jgi:predicted nucleic acid-binding protein